MKIFENIVDKLNKLEEAEENEENTSSNEEINSDDSTDTEDSNSSEDNKDNDKENDKDNDKENDKENGESDFHAENIDDFLNQTETKVSVKKIGCEPSIIFGTNDTNNHNKYRITISNKNGKISFVFWDSISNTKNNKQLNKNDAIASFAKDAEAYGVSLSYEDFKSTFGYDDSEDNRARKAYDGCRKNMEKAKKVFADGQYEELIRLASEI